MVLLQTVRSVMNDRVHATDYPYPGAVRLGAALVPGLAMTPVSSILGKRLMSPPVAAQQHDTRVSKHRAPRQSQEESVFVRFPWYPRH